MRGGDDGDLRKLSSYRGSVVLEEILSRRSMWVLVPIPSLPLASSEPLGKSIKPLSFHFLQCQITSLLLRAGNGNM